VLHIQVTVAPVLHSPVAAEAQAEVVRYLIPVVTRQEETSVRVGALSEGKESCFNSCAGMLKTTTIVAR
jgi:hypothetical protein